MTSKLRIDGEGIYLNCEQVGSIWGDDTHGWKASLLIDMLDRESGIGRYMGHQIPFPTRKLAEEWARENEHMVHVFTRRGRMPSLDDMFRYDADQRYSDEMERIDADTLDRRGEE